IYSFFKNANQLSMGIFFLATVPQNQYSYARCTTNMYSLRHANMNSHPQKILMNSHLKSTRERSGPNRLVVLFAMLACTIGLALSTKGATSTDFGKTVDKAAILLTANCS